MFGIFKRKKVAPKDDVSLEIGAFIREYCYNNNINTKVLCIDGITVIEQDNTIMCVVRAKSPQKLIGVKGAVSKDLAKRMSKHLDRELRLEIVHQSN